MLAPFEKPLSAMGKIGCRNSSIMVLAFVCVLPIGSLGQSASARQNAPTPLQSVRNDAAAGAPNKKDNSAVVGVWRGELNNMPEATLNVTDESGSLQGAILFYLIRKHEGRKTTSSPGVPEPLFNPQFDGKSLSFQMSHRHAHRNTASTPPVTFRLDLTGPDEAKLVRVSVDGPAYITMVRDKNWK